MVIYHYSTKLWGNSITDTAMINPKKKKKNLFIPSKNTETAQIPWNLKWEIATQNLIANLTLKSRQMKAVSLNQLYYHSNL